MVSGVDSPVGQQNPLIEASTNVALVNQARQGAILNTSQLVVGKQFQAEVVSSLEDGTYIVKVADVAARMQLPNSPQVGDKLSLTLISTSPRATFLLSSAESEETQTSGNPTTTTATLGASVKQLVDDYNQSVGGKGGSTAPAGLYLQGNSAVAATAEADTEPRLIVVNNPTTDSAPANFSNVGKLVNQLVQSTPQEATVVNVSRVPLLSTPDVNVNNMAKALQSGVANSGSFYESHLLQWAEGTLDVNELMKEPQASFPAPSPTTQNELANAANNNPSQALEHNNPTVTGNSLLSTITTAQTGNTPANSTANNSIVLPKEATPLIQQQLQTLEQQRFVWQGELWPGQTMHWEISRDRQDQQQSNPQEKTWHSAVRFELPVLGNVSAQLQLTGPHLRMTIQAPDAQTAQLMQMHAAELSSALENTGSQLESLLIKTKVAG